MRCQFCGWDNPQEKKSCEKCGKPLQGNTEESSSNINEHPTMRKSAKDKIVGKATVRESQPKRPGATVLETKNECPECGYIMENDVCPSCGYKQESSQASTNSQSSRLQIMSDVKKTVRPKRKGEKEGTFTLTPISEETGEPEAEALPYKGDTIVLNRENTDPKNDTITSSKQALVSHEEGRWFIEDCSEYKTTFIQTSRKIELQDGDLILLGNQLYRFDSIK